MKFLLIAVISLSLIGVVEGSEAGTKSGAADFNQRKSVTAKDKLATPYQINYQGWLASADDTLGVTGTFDMVFRLFNVPTGGSTLWDETQSDVTVDKGIFNVYLGSVNPIPASLFTGDPLWLEVQVGSEVLSPRKKLVSVGYAIRSAVADSSTITANAHKLDGNSLTDLDSRWVNEGQSNSIITGMIVDGTIQRADVGTSFKSPYADTADYASESGAVEYADSSGTAAYSWDGFHAVHADTAQWTLGGGGAAYADSAGHANVADSAGIAGNAHKLDGNPLIDLDSRWVNENQANSVNSSMIVDGQVTNDDIADNAVNSTKIQDNTIQRTDVVTNFKAPYSDTADYAKAASVGFVDSANVAANAYKLEGNSITTLDGRWVNTSVTDTISVTNSDCALSVENNSSSSYGIFGIVAYGLNSSSGTAIGGDFYTLSNGTGEHYGVYGVGHNGSSNTACGVKGYGSNTSSGGAYGGYFQASSSGTGTHYGVYAVSDSFGIYATSTATSKNYAGYFDGNVKVTGNLDASVSYTDSAGHLVPPDSIIGSIDNGGLIYLQNTGPSGDAIRVHAVEDGIQVDTANYGLYVNKANNHGVLVSNAGNDGVNATGKHTGGAFYNDTTGAAYPTLCVQNNYGNTSAERLANFLGAGFILRFYFQGDGKAYAADSWNVSKKNSKGDYESFSSPHSAYQEIIAHGTGRLINGEANVKFDASFAEFVSSAIPIEVTVTPKSWSGLYVPQVSTDGFWVKSGAGDQNCEFNWFAIGREKGHEERVLVGNIEEEERQAQLLDQREREQRQQKLLE